MSEAPLPLLDDNDSESKSDSGGMSLPLLRAASLSERKEFLCAVNTLFETALPLADRLWARFCEDVRNGHEPFSGDYSRLIDAAEQIIRTDLDDAEKLEVMNAHPRIGERRIAKLSKLSQQEQGVLSAQDKSAEMEKIYARLHTLNRQYEDKHGFRFVVFVNGRSKAQIVPVFEERLSNLTTQELSTGLKAMLLIARDRLHKLLDKQDATARSSVSAL